ncbi:hypothetical protein B0T11DRAFT_298842 [Plectosphaerella cucumerina]|uniref:Uncharacterized protein n=1 Tax=Plectosphaerella cucumerina TaxID=40658 RepID=A0A8K0TNY1_9PEZI|nr:hypothetical protein B0T11DRAFT_298842 [Plectosphaerella cucumerina]
MADLERDREFPAIPLGSCCSVYADPEVKPLAQRKRGMRHLQSQWTSTSLQSSPLQPWTGYLPQWATVPRGLINSEFGTINPHMLSSPNPGVMMGMSDPLMLSGFDKEPEGL